MKTKLPAKKTLFWMSKAIAFIALLLFATIAGAQTVKKVKWTERVNNRNATFYDVQRDFNKQWKGKLREMAREKQKVKKNKGEETEAGGFEVFKRWENYMTPRVYPSGNMTLPSTNYANFMAWQKTLGHPANNPPTNSKPTNNPPVNGPNTVTSSWTSLGPVGSPSGPAPYSRTGTGRVNFVRFDPTNSNTMYVGTPDGGLWKSTDAGATWTSNTDFLNIIGCSDLAIDPTNTNNMYLATGDIEGDRLTIGVLKSTDKGATWNTTAMTFAATDGFTISRLLMNPSNPLNMIISTNGGIFRTTDGWATVTQTESSHDFRSMEFKPGDPNTVYAAGATFSRSTDNGVTWVPVTAGLPAANVQRIALGVSAANSGYVYALIGKASDQSFLGMYRSINSGASFSLRSTSPNLLGYAADGSDATAGQAFYDLVVAVSPTNANIVTTGGVNHWQSADGGATWTNKSVWDAGQVHADVHNIDYLPGSSTTIFSCNDGGIFKSTDNATNWTDISHNLVIAEVVGIGLSANIATTIVDGEQDNGTNLKTGSSWANINGGDGGACFIDYTNNNTIYEQYVQGSFSRSDDGGATNNPITNGLPGGFDFYSAWHEDPVTSTKLYTGGTPTLYASVDQGNNWTALGTPQGTGTITEFAISPSNHAIIYAVKQDAISKSINSGVTFTDITGTLPPNAAFSNVTVSNTNPNIVWVTYSGYSAADKVYKSINGGTTWTNMSTGLPNLPINTIVHVNNNANDALYIGADIGAYYFDNTLSSWAPFMTSLPHNAVRDLKIYYPTGKIRAATYGRGVWESNLNSQQLSANDNLSSLSLTKPFAALTVVAGPDFKDYTASVSSATASIEVLAATVDPNAKIKVNGTAVTSGTASNPITLNAGSNVITTVVTAQDGTSTHSYLIRVTRTVSNNDYLSSLSLTKPFAALTVVAGPDFKDYTASVSNATASIEVLAATADPNAKIKVNGTAVTSGTASNPITLNAGSNVITTVVTAQDGTSTHSYVITVTRAAAALNIVYEPVSVAQPIDILQLANDGVVVHLGVSPNGDGINDFLLIENITNYPDNRLMIMSRSGQLVFEAKNYNNSAKVFDGHSNKTGAMQLPGTYFYSLDYTAAAGITKHKTGFIVLKY